MTGFTEHIDGVGRNVTFSQPTGLPLFELVANAPNPERDEMPSSEWLQSLVLYSSDMTEDELGSINFDGLQDAIDCAVRALNEEEGPSGSDEYRITDSIVDTNKDGSVNLDEWE